MNNCQIKSFTVYGLFGTSHVHIPFDKDIKILIGENGLGKTQILNMFYYTLSGNFLKLRECSFYRIVVEFEENTINFLKSDIKVLVHENLRGYRGLLREIISILGREQFQEIQNHILQIENYSELENYIDTISSQRAFRKMANPNSVKRVLYNYFSKMVDIKPNKNSLISAKLKANLPTQKILYFPTYRRVEEDLKNLGYDEEQFHSHDDKLIQFGMDDVKARFNKIEEDIDSLLKEGFSKISGEILSQLVKGFSEADSSVLNRIDENDIEIILARVGQQLPDKDKEEIRNIVLNQQVKNQSLLFFLQKLIEIYEKQKPLDNLVKKYKGICNKYLINKEVFYDESEIRIYIKSKLTGEEISLKNLSSGEKQILAIFSKIYLSRKDQRFIVLFDEPELSLSMKWQQQLLPDMLDSGKCDFLLAVTHSPFIFDNRLDEYAMGLSEYFTFSNNQLITA